MSTINKENATADDLNLLDFLEEENVNVDNTVDMSRENYLDSNEGNSDNYQQILSDEDIDNLSKQTKNDDDNDGLTDAEIAEKNKTAEAAKQAEIDAKKIADAQANSDPNDMTDEELLALAGKPKPVEITAPAEFNSPIEIANYLG